MKTLIENSLVYDLRNNKIIKRNILIEDGKIQQLLDIEKNKSTQKADKTIDAEGCVVMPGFKNAHTHSPMVFFRSLADDLPLEQWLEKVIFPYEAKLSPEDVYFGSLLGIMEYLKNGIVACQDMYFYQKDVARAFVQANVRCVVNGSLTSNVKSKSYNTSRESEESYDRIMTENDYFSNLSRFISYAPGVHSTYTTSAPLLKGVIKAAHELKKGLYLHLNETAFEAKTAYEKFSKYNLEYVDSLDGFKYGGAIFHGVHMQDSELEIMKKKGVAVALNACSNAKLCSGVANFEKYRKYGILCGIGTDGASSNNSLDMFKEMWTLQATNHIKFQDVETPKPYDIVKAATIGSAKLMNLEDSMFVEPGQNADLVAIDINDVNAVPFTDFCKFLVYSANPSNVKMTMVGGKVLYKDGEYHIGVDKLDIVREVVKRLKRIQQS